MNDFSQDTPHSTQDSSPPAFSERQEATFRRLLGQYECNLLTLQEHFPDVANKLAAQELACPVAVDEHGQVQIHSKLFKGSLKDYRESSMLFYDSFSNDEHAASFVLSDNDPRKQDIKAKQANAYYFHRPLEHKAHCEIVGSHQRALKKPRKKPPVRRILPVVFSVGTGFSFHLNRMVEDFDITHLVILEHDVSHLNLALFFVDLQAIVDRMSAPGKTLLLILGDTEENLHKDAILRMREYVAPFMLQHIRIYYDTSNPGFAKEFVKTLKDEIWTFFHGWGFLDDEILSVYNSTCNYRANTPLLLRVARHTVDTPIFIVGAGPSLDSIIPIIKDNRDHIIVMSCGSGISALRKNNIKPDLHVEIERTSYTAEMLLAMAEKEWLRDIPFIGTQLMSPEVYKIFRKKAAVLKLNDTASKMLDPDDRFAKIMTNPTCTNGGVHIALTLGFRNIYLAGVDVGFVNQDKHHAESSMYYSEGEGNDDDAVLKVRKIADSNMRSSQKVPGNFRKTVFSVPEFITTRDIIATALALFPGNKTYNLNDGAKIPGAKPLRPERVNIKPKPIDRKKLVNDVFENFQSQKHLDHISRMDELTQQVHLLTKDIEDMLSKNQQKTASDVLNALSGIYIYLRNPKTITLPVITLTLGGVCIMCNYAYRNTLFVNDDASAVASFNLFKKQLVKALRQAEKIISDLNTKEKLRVQHV